VDESEVDHWLGLACPGSKTDTFADVAMTSRLVKGRGYTARCRNNPESHTFSFDHTTLKGERV